MLYAITTMARDTSRMNCILIAVIFISVAQAQVDLSFTAPTAYVSLDATFRCDYNLTTGGATLKSIEITRGVSNEVTAYYNASEATTTYHPNGTFVGTSSTGSYSLVIQGVTSTDAMDYTCTVTDSNDATGSGAHTLVVQDGCESNPCQNSGVCNGTIGPDAWDFACECAPDFIGTFCETQINDCTSNTCKNGGTCVDGVNSFTCTCTSCYNGTLCEDKIFDECASDPCQKGGTCTDLCGKFECACPVNTNGVTCSGVCNNIVSISNGSSVAIGSDVTLTCEATVGANAVFWSKKSDGTSPYATTKSHTITNIKPADAGRHYCFVETTACTSRQHVILSVTFELYPNETHFENITIEEQADRTLRCQASGKPTPTVQWFFVPKPKALDESQSPANITTPSPTSTTLAAPVAVTNATENSTTYIITNADQDDAGTYTCVASVADGLLKQDIEVKHVSVVQSTGKAGLENWEIALIVIGCVLAVVLIVVIIFVVLWKTGKAGAICPSDKAGVAEKGKSSSAPYESREKKKLRTDADDEEPRSLPAPPPGTRGNALPPLDMEAEKSKTKKKKIKRREASDEEDY